MRDGLAAESALRVPPYELLIRPHPQYLALAITGTRPHEIYRSLFTHDITHERLVDILNNLQQQKALGSGRFQTQIEAMLGRHMQV